MTGAAASCWAVIPVKAPGEGKSRLAGVLGPLGRAALVHRMLERVVGAAEASGVVDRLFVVGASDHGLGARVTLLPDAGGGLNAALSAAMSRLPAGPPPDRVIVVAADLPELAPIDFAMLADVPAGAVAIAPDRHGTGTNAISLPWSCVRRFPFHFGTGSFVAHREQVRRLGYTVEVMLSDGLEKDVDDPSDLIEAKGRLQDAI